MKHFPLLLVGLVVVVVAGGSCERHEFDGAAGTRQLHEHPHGRADADAEHAEKPAH